VDGASISVVVGVDVAVPEGWVGVNAGASTSDIGSAGIIVDSGAGVSRGVDIRVVAGVKFSAKVRICVNVGHVASVSAIVCIGRLGIGVSVGGRFNGRVSS